MKQVTFGSSQEVGPAWNPDGTTIAFYTLPEQTSQIFTVKTDGSDLQQITTEAAPSFGPVWDASGTRLIFHRRINGKQSLVSSDISTGQETVILANENNNHNPTWITSQGIEK